MTRLGHQLGIRVQVLFTAGSQRSQYLAALLARHVEQQYSGALEWRQRLAIV